MQKTNKSEVIRKLIKDKRDWFTSFQVANATGIARKGVSAILSSWAAQGLLEKEQTESGMARVRYRVVRGALNGPVTVSIARYRDFSNIFNALVLKRASLDDRPSLV